MTERYTRVCMRAMEWYAQSSVSGVISTISDRKFSRNWVLFSATCRRLQYSLQRRGKSQSLLAFPHSLALSHSQSHTPLNSASLTHMQTHVYKTDLHAVQWRQHLGARKTCPADSKELGNRDCRSVETERESLRRVGGFQYGFLKKLPRCLIIP